jgi:hypothetical protein
MQSSVRGSGCGSLKVVVHRPVLLCLFAPRTLLEHAYYVFGRWLRQLALGAVHPSALAAVVVEATVDATRPHLDKGS